MTIYQVGSAEGYEFCHPVREEGFKFFSNILVGNPLQRQWSPEPVVVVREDEGRKLLESDSPWIARYALVLRQRAIEGMGTLLEKNGEILPLSCDDADLSLYNVTQVVDAVDEAKSQLKRFSSGRIMDIERYVWAPELIDGVDIFKIPNLRTSPIFVSDHFVAKWHSLQLRGLKFTPA